MFSRNVAHLVVMVVIASAAFLVVEEPVARAQAQAVFQDPGCTANALPRNDDDYTDPVPIGFDVFFGNEFRSTLRISNNGYVSFGPQTLLWWMLHAWEMFDVPLIAAFHADIDTRAPGTSPVTYGNIMFGLHRALCINWVNVGYFDTRDDLLDSFQLVLVERSDIGAGDVDVYLNYDQVQWDHGIAVLSARAGIFDGTSVLNELAGSGVTSALLDGGPDALTNHSIGASQLGRYMFPLRSGIPPLTPIVSGRVLDTNGVPVAAALVDACDTCVGVNSCVHGSTDSRGHYDLRGFAPADVNDCRGWKVSISPPVGSSLLTNSRNVSFTATDEVIADADVVLAFPAFIPSGTSITPSVGGFGAVPRVYWLSPLTLTTKGCPSIDGLTPPVARYMVAQDDNPDLTRCDAGPSPSDPTLLRCGAIIETPLRSGTYVASVDPLAPAHGLVKVTMGLTCPKDPSDPNPAPSGSSSFNLYIDPSGWVQTVEGVPLPGAQVTLFRSESAQGPFEQVPDGSALMSPKNRQNPDHTDTEGHFSWDTVAGFYVVRAEYPGCVSPTSPLQTFVETDVLAVPPEWTDLHLYLDCGQIAPPRLSLPTQVLADATSTAGAVVSYTVSANDDRDGPVPVTCSQPSGSLFAIGTTVMVCSASNVVGNVGHGSFPVIVSYAWSNVLPPLQPGAGNRLKRGRTVAVKFALTGASAGITNLVAHLYVAAVIGGVPGPEVPAMSEHEDCHGSKFRYDGHDRQYEFDWSTKHLAKGHYQLRIDLGDGVSRTVPLELR